MSDYVMQFCICKRFGMIKIFCCCFIICFIFADFQNFEQLGMDTLADFVTCGHG